jgi:hypothetical protein
MQQVVKSLCYIMQRGVKFFTCILQRGVKSMIFAEVFPLHVAVGRCDSLLHLAVGPPTAKCSPEVKGKTPGNISLLHDAEVRFHSLPHDAAGSQV